MTWAHAHNGSGNIAPRGLKTGHWKAKILGISMVCRPLKLNPTNKKSYSLVLFSLVMEKLIFSWGGVWWGSNEKKMRKARLGV